MKKETKYTIGAYETISPDLEANFLTGGELVLGRKFIKYLEQGQHKTKFLSNTILEYLESHLIPVEDKDEFQKMRIQFSKEKDEIAKLRIIFQYFIFGILLFKSSNGDYYEFHIKKTNSIMKHLAKLEKEINKFETEINKLKTEIDNN